MRLRLVGPGAGSHRSTKTILRGILVLWNAHFEANWGQTCYSGDVVAPQRPHVEPALCMCSCCWKTRAFDMCVLNKVVCLLTYLRTTGRKLVQEPTSERSRQIRQTPATK